jgi:hypothetical protein
MTWTLSFAGFNWDFVNTCSIWGSHCRKYIDVGLLNSNAVSEALDVDTVRSSGKAIVYLQIHAANNPQDQYKSHLMQ